MDIIIYYYPGAIPEIFKLRRCPWCPADSPHFQDPEEEPLSGEEITGVPDAFQTHCKNSHSIAEPDLQCRNALMERNEEDDDERATALRAEIIARHPGILKEKARKGKPPAGRRRAGHVPQITCEICCEHFTSSAGAMELHALAHTRGDYVKYGQIWRYGDDGERIKTSEFVPSEHIWDSNQGRYFMGSNAYVTRCHVPEDACYMTRSGKFGIKCRKCGTFKKQLQEEGQQVITEFTRSMMKQVDDMQKHEMACKGKKEAMPPQRADADDPAIPPPPNSL
ncbi:unnamed protein product [Amoebophrya sp. A120]|nr:unnamed protein product [Amoebophrya sp. A120]|eukprot:GSA120T00002006001.1